MPCAPGWHVLRERRRADGSREGCQGQHGPDREHAIRTRGERFRSPGQGRRPFGRGRRGVPAVDAPTPAAPALPERLVNINSGTHDFAGVRSVSDALAVEFTRLGFSTRWVDGAAWQRAGHLIAERHGNGRGPKVLLIGHLDTVFEPDSPFQRFERVAGDSARGPGIADMKGGDVVMLLALEALLDAG